ncbi:hypothetical protein ACWCQ0_00570 [Streptomyces massasporeus]|uniref:Uncharacterized protein n=1 Tax=Streptomyces massasporeus TaxID=67324 RepID=A0ABW6L9C1_9ACTN
MLVVEAAATNNDTETYYAATPDGIERLDGNPATRPRAAGIGATFEAPVRARHVSSTRVVEESDEVAPGVYRVRGDQTRDRSAVRS